MMLVKSCNTRTPRLWVSQVSTPVRRAIPLRSERQSATSEAAPVERESTQSRTSRPLTCVSGRVGPRDGLARGGRDRDAGTGAQARRGDRRARRRGGGADRGPQRAGRAVHVTRRVGGHATEAQERDRRGEAA